jgi:hypothetical protein
MNGNVNFGKFNFQDGLINDVTHRPEGFGKNPA